VDKKSGTLGLAGHRERQIAVDADHNNICKFANAEDDDYEQISSNLVWLVNAAIEAGMDDEGTPTSPEAPLTPKSKLDCKYTLDT
jgi:hypothetical protein